MHKNTKDPIRRLNKINRHIQRSNKLDSKSKGGKFETSKTSTAPVGLNGHTFTEKWKQLQQKGFEQEVDIGECYAALIKEKKKAREQLKPIELLEEVERRYL